MAVETPRKLAGQHEFVAARIGELPVAARAGLTSELLFTLKASRPGFWLTTLWFYLMPHDGRFAPANGAFWLGLVYITLPLGMLIYAGNDLSDAETDRLNPRKDSFLFGARPTPDQLFELPWRICLVQVPFVALFSAIWGFKALLWFAVLAGGSALYNRKGGGAKDVPIFDLLFQCGYLLVFVLSDWTRGAPSAWPIYAFGFAFAAHSHLFGQIMDVAPDARAGRRTTAVWLGVVRAKLFIAALLLLEVALATLLPFKPYLAPLLAIGALFFALDALVWRARPYPLAFLKLFFVGFNLALLLEIGLVASGVDVDGFYDALWRVRVEQRDGTIIERAQSRGLAELAGQIQHADETQAINCGAIARAKTTTQKQTGRDFIEIVRARTAPKARQTQRVRQVIRRVNRATPRG